jgi:hypothetical protein
MNNKIAAEVDWLFREANDPRSSLQRNPVTEGLWVKGLDPIKPQKLAAERALAARAWFAQNGPPDAQPLPLPCDDRELAAIMHEVAHISGLLGERALGVRSAGSV